MNSHEIVITNETVKLLRFIRKNQNCTFMEIKTRFADLDYMELICLCISGYLVCEKPGKIVTNFRDGQISMSKDYRFWASPKTDQLLQERRRIWLQWIIPNVISGIALILSIITLLLSLMPQVTEVRILP